MPTLLCYGDSNTFGYLSGGLSLSDAQRWPGLLKTSLRDTWRIQVDAACGRFLYGTDSAPSLYDGGPHLYQRLSQHPVDAFILQLGINDILLNGLGADALGDYLITLLERLRALPHPPAHIFLIAPAIQTDDVVLAATVGHLHTRYHQLADAQLTVVDAACAALGTDGVHLTEHGHAQLAAAVLQALRLVERSLPS